MKRATPKTIDQYLARLSADKRAALQHVRRAIRAAAPGVEECISYRSPAFRYKGRMLAWLGASANHCSFYPGAIVASLKQELKRYDISRGTIRFPPERPLPAALVRRIVKAKIARARTPRRGRC